jgi:hypothetical protein
MWIVAGLFATGLLLQLVAGAVMLWVLEGLGWEVVLASQRGELGPDP